MKDDSRLIDEALRGDSAAFGQLVQRYQGRLFNTLLHITGTVEEAEDVGQEAFAQAYLKLGAFERKSAFYTWLYRIAFNLHVSRRRRKHVETSIERTRDSTGAEPQDPGEGPTDQVLREERAALVHVALGTLSDEHRTILVLREMDGCCYDTIGEILDLPVGTVRSRLHRARQELRERLKDVLQENLSEQA